MIFGSNENTHRTGVSVPKLFTLAFLVSGFTQMNPDTVVSER